MFKSGQVPEELCHKNSNSEANIQILYNIHYFLQDILLFST